MSLASSPQEQEVGAPPAIDVHLMTRCVYHKIYSKRGTKPPM